MNIKDGKMDTQDPDDCDPYLAEALLIWVGACVLAVGLVAWWWVG